MYGGRDVVMGRLIRIILMLFLVLGGVTLLYAYTWKMIYNHWPTLKEAREAIGEAWRDTREDLRR